MVTDERLAAYIAGEMEADERAAFEMELLADEGARGELLAQQRVSAGLRALLAPDHERLARAIMATMRGLSDEAIERRVVSLEPQPRREASRPTPAWWMWPLAAAALVLVGLFSFKLISPQGGRPSGTASRESVALLSRTVAARWNGSAREPGQALAPGWLRLRAGVVEIEFSRGARVVLEGPAEFQLVSNNEGFLQRGKLRAFVPEAAHGFTIRGEGFAVVDLGTEFGVIAGEKPEVHVFTGRVELARTTGPARVLEAGRAARMGEGDWLDVPAEASAFINPEELQRIERREAWRRSITALDAHPAAVVHYDFEKAAGMLANGVRGRDVAASVTGCEAVEGRWPGKGALEFKRAEDRVRFTVPGEMQSLTLLAWVRVDGLPNTQSSLLMGESELPGEVHWYLHREGGVGFAVIAPDGQWRGAQTPVLLRRDVFGRWLFLAVTFDGASGTATHYLNGQPVDTQALDRVGPLRLRTAEIGNWGVRPGDPLRASKRAAKEPGGYVRNLHGCVDEFAILSAPLSAKEIQNLYEAGRPAPTLPK